MSKQAVAVLGATSPVGDFLLRKLALAGTEVIAFTRGDVGHKLSGSSLTWRSFSQDLSDITISDCICLAPIWVLPEHFSLLERLGVRRVVALSSTSRFTKTTSPDPKERRTVTRLAEGEEALARWGAERGVEWVVLRPTLIYGGGRDKNISSIARVIQRLHFFPLVDGGRGLRQPVHGEDVARAALLALEQRNVVNRAFNISGAEVLSYRRMVERVFLAMGRRPRLLSLPAPMLEMAVRLLAKVPGFDWVSVGMVERMTRDMVFDHEEAAKAFGFNPRGFEPSQADLPELAKT
ncbi:MAG TPA: NAD-dependent epimerase/dehydratase family protein [Gammaproteobacteria bacterium]|nr:NAD-dependent epimerase/dehydratase family protein [Gammaproteobacteria bacterium]